MGRGLLLWMLGVPLPIILLLAMCSSHWLLGDLMESLYPQQPAGEALSGGWQPGNAVASWPAIIAGAFVAAAVTVVLFALGSGLGFASISPWQGRGMGATAFVMTGAIWLIVTQGVAAGIGGYHARRARSRL